MNAESILSRRPCEPRPKSEQLFAKSTYRKRRNTLLAGLAAVSLGLASAGSAFAQVWGINIDVNCAESGGPRPFSGQGVLGGPNEIWNHIDGGKTTANLLDNAGTQTGVSIYVSKGGGWSDTGGFNNLFNDWVKTDNPTDPLEILVSGLDPSHTYSVVTYSAGNEGNQGASYTGDIVGETTGAHRNSYELGVNYLRLDNFVPTSGTLTLHLLHNSGNPQFGDWNGLQIVRTDVTLKVPEITTQPESQSVRAGKSISLTVGVDAGGLLYSSQWLFNQTPIPGATSGTLALNNVTAAAAGNYSVIISNSQGVVTSAVAVVTIDSKTTTSFFFGGDQGEGLDLHGTGFALAEYYGTDLGALQIQDVTLTCNPARILTGYPNYGGNVPNFGASSSDANLGAIADNWFEGSPDKLSFSIPTANGQAYKLQLLFHDGFAGFSRPMSIKIGSQVLETSMDPIAFGASINNPKGIVLGYFFTGNGSDLPIEITGLTVNGPALLNALTLQALPAAPQALYLAAAPLSQTNVIGGTTATFSAMAGGSQPPFSYQWSFAGTPISGATNRDLVIANVKEINAGTYSVVVSNSVNSVSASAQLGLDPNCAMVVASTPDELDLQGNFALAEYYANYNAGDLVVGDVVFKPSSRPGTTPHDSANFRPNFGSSPDQVNLATLSEHNSWGDINFSIETVPGKKYKLQLLFHDNWNAGVGQRIFKIVVGGVELPFTLDLVSMGAYQAQPKAVAVYYPFTATASTMSISLVPISDNPVLSALALEDVTPGSPVAPTFVTPLASQMAFPGNTVQLIARANGTDLAYKWEKLVGESYTTVQNAGNISGATTRALTIANLSAADAGSYRVTVSNTGGSIQATALVKVLVNQPQGIIGHWLSGAQSLADTAGFAAAGTHDGVLVGNTGAAAWANDVPPTFTGSSLNLSGGDVAVSILNTSLADANYVPTFDSIIQNGFSIAFWAKGTPGGWSPYLSKKGEDGIGFQVRTHGGNGKPTFTIRGTPGEDDPQGPLDAASPQWHHFAATWDGTTGVRKLYVDNKLSITVNNDSAPMTVGDAYRLVLGARNNDARQVNNNGNWFKGSLFDVRVYGYALDTTEIVGINNMTNPAPSIAKSLDDIAVVVGETAQFDASAVEGNGLSFQWQILNNGNYENLTDGGKFSGVTTRVMTLSNAALANAGSYRLHVWNVTGSLDCPIRLAVYTNLHTMLGHWLTGSESYADVSGFTPAGTHDGSIQGGGAGTATWDSDIPANFTGKSLNLTAGDAGLFIANSSTRDAGYVQTFDAAMARAGTISIWGKGWPGNWSAFISKRGEQDLGWQVRRFDGSALPDFTVGGDNINSAIGIDTVNAAWHHYAATWDTVAGTRKLYVDNVLVAARYNVFTPLPRAAGDYLVLGGKYQDGNSGSWCRSKLFDVRIYGYALNAQELQAVNKISNSNGSVVVSEVTGPAVGQGLDLQGNFVLAEYFGNEGGPVLPIAGVAFAASTRVGATPGSENRPDFGPNPDQVNLSTLSYQSVYGALNFTIPTIAGVQYKLQLICHDNHYTGPGSRQFLMKIDGTDPVFLDLAGMGANVSNPKDIVLSYVFTGSGSPLSISSISGNDFPTISGFTLEDLTSPVATPVLLAPVQSQAAPLGSTVYLAANVGGLNLTYRWQKEVGGNFQDITDRANVSGSSTSILTISGLTAEDLAAYRVVVSNTAGQVESTATVSLPIPETPTMTASAVVNGEFTLSWDTGILQSTAALNGTNTVWVTESTTSPVTINLNQTTGNKFFRVISE